MNFELEIKGNDVKISFSDGKIEIVKVDDMFEISSVVYMILIKKLKGKSLKQLKLSGFDYRTYRRTKIIDNSGNQ